MIRTDQSGSRRLSAPAISACGRNRHDSQRTPTTHAFNSTSIARFDQGRTPRSAFACTTRSSWVCSQKHVWGCHPSTFIDHYRACDRRTTLTSASGPGTASTGAASILRSDGSPSSTSSRTASNTPRDVSRGIAREPTSRDVLRPLRERMVAGSTPSRSAASFTASPATCGARARSSTRSSRCARWHEDLRLHAGQ